ncbi:Ig-like domain repeat protein [Dethiobacter alkaliphilus]|uniref:Ig-like domain repeat protein n=1 Tax=Dethiobacter alkaliphilus TaxID=427926 RepID=UPI002226A8D6|nr:Ig-like domain repeat protein [Dethiobacter alkaliphilus]MCW3491317.1 Ig-like domain repeat protein [Dethiobacter alkaliphilus]
MKKNRLILVIVLLLIFVAGVVIVRAAENFSFTDLSPREGSTRSVSSFRISTYIMADAALDRNTATMTINGTTYPATFNSWWTTRDGQLHYDVSDLPDGDYTVTAAIKDVNGNEGSHTWQFRVAVPPVITDLYPADNSAHQQVDVIRARVYDPNGEINPDSIILKLDDVQVEHVFDGETGYVTYDLPELADGSYNVSLYVEDDAENSRSRAWSFTLDNEPPEFKSLTPGDNATLKRETVNISARVEDEISHLQQSSLRMYLNGEQVSAGFEYDYYWWEHRYEYRNGTVRYTAADLTDGTYEVELEMADKAGNVGSRTWTFTVAVPPVISELYPADGTVHTAVDKITALASDPNGSVDPDSVLMELNGAAVETVFNEDSGEIKAVFPDGLETGEYNVYLKIADMAGNEADAQWSFTVDASPPEFSNLLPSEGSTVNVANPEIKVRIDDPDGIKSGTPKMYIDGEEVSATFEYYWYWGPWWQEIIDYTRGTLTYKPVALANGEREVRVEAEDEAGNQGSVTWQFSVAAEPKIQLVTPAADSTLSDLRQEIVVEFYNYQELTQDDILFIVGGETITPEIDYLGGYQMQLTYVPAEDYPNEQYLDISLTLDGGDSLQTFKEWSYYLNTYEEMVGSGKDISSCSMCHDGVQIKYDQCGSCHSWDIYLWQEQCFDCHLTHFPPYQHHTFSIYPHDTVGDHKLLPEELTGCDQCHSRVLTREHAREGLTDKNGEPMTCATCHESTREDVQTAITSGNLDCGACHSIDTTSGGHAEAHEVSLGEQCVDCHGNNMMYEKEHHQEDGCKGCHSNPAPRVQRAIQFQNRTCFGCHQEPHGVKMSVVRDDIVVYDGVSWSKPDPAVVWAGEGWLPDELNNDMALVLYSTATQLNSSTVNQFYKVEMAERGWTLLEEESGENGAFSLMFKKGRRHCLIWLYQGMSPLSGGGQGYRILTVYN